MGDPSSLERSIHSAVRHPLLRSRAVLAAALLTLPLLAAGSCAPPPVEFGLPTLAAVMPVSIGLAPGVDPAAVRVRLDDLDVTASFAPAGPGLVGSIPVPAPGSHRLSVTRPLPAPLFVSFTTGVDFESPSATPAVLAVEPAADVTNVPRGAWLRFRFASPLEDSDLAGFGFGLECDGARIERTAHALTDGALILNPTPALPAGASCRAAWRGEGGAVAETRFTVADAAAGAPALVLYERASPQSIAPFPDDYWIVADASQPSGRRVAMPDPAFPESLQRQAFGALAKAVNEADGWSRQTPIVIALSHPLDPSLAPADPFAAQDPFAPIVLVDVDAASPDYGSRVPYRLLLRTDPRRSGGFDHSAILFPTIDLREQGRYAVVFTRRAFASGEPGRDFGPAPLFAQVLAGASPGEPPQATQARAAVGDVLDRVASLPDVPIPREDVALALSLSIRTQPGVSDLVHVKEQALAGRAAGAGAARRSHGSVSDAGQLLHPPHRQPGGRGARRACGCLATATPPPPSCAIRPRARPVPTGFDEAPLVMTLPRAALDGPVFPVIYQHGNPGSPTELLSSRNEGIDDAGLALLGFQDTLNRELAQDLQTQVLLIFAGLLGNQRLGDYWLQTGADQINFLRAIQGLSSLDVLHEAADGSPALGPDGQPEIDPSTILYKGISEGANNAQRFLPFAPEILAAEATVGGARLGETLIHQSADEILTQIGVFLTQITPVELWVGLSLFQAAFDPQDGHTYLRYLYREPLLPFAGSSDVTPPSTIWTEGIGDSLVPNNATRAMAKELGIPHVRPVARALPTLEQVDPPLAGNIAPGITAGYFQYDPFTTPDCVTKMQFEGHYCPQSGAEALAQRLHFLLSALAGEAEIIDPF